MGWGARRTVLVCALAAALGLLSACTDTCEPGTCEPCVGETCEVRCVEPDDEDVWYVCPWECLDDASCDFTCRTDGCKLQCDGSTCTCDICDAHCTGGSDCSVSGRGGRVGCDASTCHLNCDGAEAPVPCLEACTNGSSCTLSCGTDPGHSTQVGDRAPSCAMSCDASSSCHITCALHVPCALCCGGSSDCTLDCPTGGTTCPDGVLVCGDTSCETASSACPVYTEEWMKGW